MNENTKKVVVCTGSGRHGGLGEAILLRFANEGYKVVVTDIGNNSDRHLASSADMESVAAGLKSLGVEVLCLPCDVRLPDSVAALFDEVIARFGRLDVLINNAGIAFPQALKNMKEEEWNRMLSIHLDGAFSVTKSCWPYFIKQKYGRVVMTSSPAGLYGTDGSVHYAVSKMGVVGFASSLQIEANRMKLDFRANCIAPQAATRMVADFGKAVANRRRRNKKS